MNTITAMRALVGQPTRPEPLSEARIARAKAAYTTRRVDLRKAHGLVRAGAKPRFGDLVLARVEQIGQHTRIELATGRRAQLHPGDEIVVCFGARYAPDQFEAYLPDDLGPCHLVAAGGIAARCESRHRRMKPATLIQPIGLLTDRRGRRINLGDWGLPERRPVRPRLVLAVVGTSMNAGKTTTAQGLVRGLLARGWKTAAGKVTGTGSGPDRWVMVDAGAEPVLDFTDAGRCSTFGLDGHEVEAIFEQLLAHLGGSGADAVVLEIADGLLQRETAALLASETFTRSVDGLFFAAPDALGAIAGAEHLRVRGLPLVGVSGAVTASPLAVREVGPSAGVPVYDCEALSSGRWVDTVADAPLPTEPAAPPAPELEPMPALAVGATA